MYLIGRSGSRKRDVRSHCERLELRAQTEAEAAALAVIFYCSVTKGGVDFAKLAKAAERLHKQAALAPQEPRT